MRPKAASFNQFDSMAQMSSATGVPIDVLKSAKREGCQFIRHGRCDLKVFNEWFFSRSGDGVDWTKRSKRGEALLRELKLEIERKETIPFSTVTQFVGGLTGVFFGFLQRFKSEAPAVLKGKDEIQIHTWANEHAELVKSELTAKLNEWEKKGTN